MFKKTMQRYAYFFVPQNFFCQNVQESQNLFYQNMQESQNLFARKSIVAPKNAVMRTSKC